MQYPVHFPSWLALGLALGVLSGTPVRAVAAEPVGESGEPALALPRLQAGDHPVAVPERSGSYYTTYDLGPVAGDAMRRRYATRIFQPGTPRITWPGVGEPGMPVRYLFSDGTRLEWLLDQTGGMREIAGPDARTEGPSPAQAAPAEPPAPAPGEVVRAGSGAGWLFRFRPAGGELLTRIRLSDGLSLRVPGAERAQAGSRLEILDRRGAPVLVYDFPGAQVEAKPQGGDEYRVRVTRVAASFGDSSGGPVIDASIVPAGTWGGYQCYRADGSGALPGSAYNSNPYQWNYTGEYYHSSGETSYHCSAYILFPLGGAVPSSATVTGLWLWPLNISSVSGGAQSLIFRDIDNGQPLDSDAGKTYNVNYYNDLGNMAGGRPSYGSTTLSATGPGSCTVGSAYCPELDATAVEDANRRLRSQSWFGVSIWDTSATPGTYLTANSGASSLYVYYTDYAPSQLNINYVWVRNSNNDEIHIYNHGEALNLSGWKLRFANPGTTYSAWSFPSYVLPHHGLLKVRTVAGVNTADTLFTGGSIGVLTGDASVSLLRPDNSHADYVCFEAMTPLAGAGWAGPCATHYASYETEYDVYRIRDTDTDGRNDWNGHRGFTADPPAFGLNPGQDGSRRRSDVFINEFLVWNGFNRIELANYGPTVDLAGWSVTIYNAHGNYGTYLGAFTFPAGNVVNNGQYVWLEPGTTYFPAPDATHRNLGFAVDWDVAQRGGEIILRDSAGRTRDYVKFGNVVYDHMPADFAWTGDMIPIDSYTGSTNIDVWRAGDFVTESAAGWTWSTSYQGSFPGPNTSQLGALRNQDRIFTGQWSAAAGIDYWCYNSSPSSCTGPYGAGAVIKVTRQVALEEFVIQGAAVNGPRNGLMVVKKQGSANPVFSQAVSIPEAGQGLVRSGRIVGTLRLDPGIYAIMLYMDGAWFDAESYGPMDSTTDPANPFLSNARLSFGRVLGYTYESGFSPTGAFAINQSYAPHAELVTIDPPLITSAAGLPDGIAGVAYAGFTHTATGGYGAYTWSVAAGGALPPGLSLSTGGVLSGTPTTAGFYHYTVQVTDAAGMTATQAVSLAVYQALTVATTAVPDADTRVAYGYRLWAIGGKTPYSWGCTGLPAGLSCAANGDITGTPTAADGTYNFTATVTDARPVQASRVISIRVRANLVILTPSPLPNGTVGAVYGATLTGMGGTGAVSWTLIGGTLPPGLSLVTAGGNGNVQGTPTAPPSIPTTYNFTVRYTVGAANTSKAFSITIGAYTAPPFWQRRGLTGGELTALYYSPNFIQDGVMIGTNGTVLYASTNRGYFWKPMRLRLTARRNGAASSIPDRVTSVAFAPDFDGRPLSDPNRPPAASRRLAVTADHSGVWYSDDFDGSWTAVSGGLSAPDGAAFAFADNAFFSPNFNSDKRLYVRSWNSGYGVSMVYRGVVDTAAKTAAWTPASNNQPDLAGLSYSPAFASDATIFAPGTFGGGTQGSGLYKSTDGGASWTLVQNYINMNWAVSRLVYSPNYAADGTVAMLRGFATPVISRNRGLSFEPLCGATGGSAFQVRFPPTYNTASNPVIYLGGYGGQVLVSTDNGATCQISGTGGVGNSELNALAGFEISPDFANDRTILSLGQQGKALYRSEDAGVSWGLSDGGLYIQNITALAMPRDYATSGRIYLGTKYEAYWSGDRGATWNKSENFGLQVDSLKVDPQDSFHVFLYTCDGTFIGTCAMYQSWDGGANYDFITGTSDGEMITTPHAFQAGTNGSDIPVLGWAVASDYTPAKVLWTSVDGGASFNTVAGPSSYYPTGFQQSFGFSSGFGNFSDSFGCFNYVDGPQSRPICSNTLNQASPSFFNIPAPSGDAPPAFPPDFNYSNGVNGTSSHTFVMNCAKSTNAGATFTAIPASGAGCDPNGEIALGNASNLFSYVRLPGGANAAPGLFRSYDGGASFSRASISGDPADYAGEFDVINEIHVSPDYANDSTVLVATNAGLYISHDDGDTWMLSSGVDPISPNVTATAANPNSAGGVVVGTWSGEVFYSADSGATWARIQNGISGAPVNSLLALNSGGTTVLLAATPNGVWRSTVSGVSWSGVWSRTLTGSYARLSSATISGLLYEYAAPSVAGAPSYRSSNLGVGWSAMGSGANGSAAFDYNGQMTPTLADPVLADALASRSKSAGDLVEAVNTAPMWGALVANGAQYSSDNGVNWNAAPGVNDYTLPQLSGYTSVGALGLNAFTGAREVVVGHSSQGVFLSRDGGVTWRNVSGPGSGLEATSKNVSTFLASPNNDSGLDLLAGVNGSTNGGVYLSADGGEHWTQVNQGFDPNNLSISTLVKTSCAGCTPQYYSGSYGGGLYTRTIAIVNKPAFPNAPKYCFGGATCTTGSTANCDNLNASGPVNGGQGFKLCGANFQAGAQVEFDGVPATGCTTQNANVITCTTTPAHVANSVKVRVRNPDTRVGYLPVDYTYVGGSSRTTDSLRVAKSGANAMLTWTCGGCSASAPARINRAQDAQFNVYLENYNGGTGGSYNNSGAVGTAQSYFWTVE